MQHGSWEVRREVAALKKQLPQENGDGTSVGGGGLQTDRARSHALNLISCTLTNFYCMWQWLMGERETGREREGVRVATEARHCSKVVTCHFLWPFYCTANFCFRQRQRAVAVCRRWHSMRHRAEEGSWVAGGGGGGGVAQWSLGGNVIPQAEAKGNVVEIKCPTVAGQRGWSGSSGRFARRLHPRGQVGLVSVWAWLCRVAAAGALSSVLQLRVVISEINLHCTRNFTTAA